MFDEERARRNATRRNRDGSQRDSDRNGRPPSPQPSRQPVVNTGAELRERFEQSLAAADHDAAVDQLRSEARSPDPETRMAALDHLAAVLIVGAGHLGFHDQLDEAARILRERLDTEHDPGRIARLSNNLAAALFYRFQHDSDPTDLANAIACYERAIDSAPDDATRWTYTANLGGVLCIDYQQNGHDDALTRSVTLLRQAWKDRALSTDGVADVIGNYSTALQLRFLDTGNLADLNEAIDVARQAAAESRSDADLRAAESALSGALVDRFDMTGRTAELDEAVSIYRTRTESFDQVDPAFPDWAQNLARTLCTRYEATGRQADLNEAIDWLRAARSRRPTGHIDRAISDNTLASAYQSRFELHGAHHDLDLAVAVHREAVRETPPEHVSMPVHLTGLANALHTRFELHHSASDLDEAIDLLRRAAAVPTAGVFAASIVTNLGGALLARFRHDTTGGDITDLEDAVANFRQATAESQDYAQACAFAANLGEALALVAEHTRRVADIDEAVQTLHTAVDLAPPGHPELVTILGYLAHAQDLRQQLVGPLDAADSSDETWHRAISLGAAAARRRLQAARDWADSTERRRDARQALLAYTALSEVMPLTAWHGLERGDRELVIDKCADVGSAGAAWALENHATIQAVQLLEQGRAVLWSQRLTARSEDELLRTGSPEIAARLDDLRSQLDSM